MAAKKTIASHILQRSACGPLQQSAVFRTQKARQQALSHRKIRKSAVPSGKRLQFANLNMAIECHRFIVSCPIEPFVDLSMVFFYVFSRQTHWFFPWYDLPVILNS